MSSSQRVLSREAALFSVSRDAVLERLSSSRSVRSHSILQVVPKKYSSHSPLMMALEKGQDGDKMVETLLELGASVAFNNKVGVVIKGMLCLILL